MRPHPIATRQSGRNGSLPAMTPLLTNGDGPQRVLCLGAHADDIEIGCGATLLHLLEQPSPPAVRWVVFSADADRAREARHSASLYLDGDGRHAVEVLNFEDGFFPYRGSAIKERFRTLRDGFVPDVIFTHYLDDRHQDHRLVADLTWNTFRDHLILEYEIPKYDGDLGRPNTYVSVDERHCRAKIRHLHDAFPSQCSKPWFSEETFIGLMRLRGIEARSDYAEAFHCRKLRLW